MTLGIRRPHLGEALLVTVVAVGTSLALCRPWLRDLSGAVPADASWDPVYFAWQLSWVGHAVWNRPGELWTTPAFDGAPDNLAFTDTVLGYAPLSLVSGSGAAGGIRQYNLGILVATVTAFVGCYLLARVLGAHPAGAFVAGAGFAFAPWRIQQINHLNVLSTGGMALALALLLAGHGWSLRHGWRPERTRWPLVVCGWLVACYQLTFGFALGIVFGTVLALVGVLLALGWLWRWSTRPRTDPPVRRVVVADAGGALAFLLTVALLVRPYLRVLDAHPEARRSEGYLDLFSPPPLGLLTGPEGSRWYQDLHVGWRESLSWPNEMVLLPGFALAVLALVGLVVSCWPVRRRLGVFAGVVVAAVLTLGVNGPAGGRFTFLPLWQHLPGWNTMRTPGRLVIWVTLGLCLLAAGAVSRITELVLTRGRAAATVIGDAPGETRGEVPGETLGEIPGRTSREAPGGPRRPSGGRFAWTALPAPWAVLLAASVVLPAGVVAVEGRATGATREIPPSPLSAATPEKVLVLPTGPCLDYQAMLWGAQGWPALLNGSSGFETTDQQRMRTEVESFPDAASVRYLRSRGVRTVIAVRSLLPGSAWSDAADIPVDGLGITRQDRGSTLVFAL